MKHKFTGAAFFAVSILCTVFLQSKAEAQIVYTIQDLGVPPVPGDFSVTGMNSRGDIVGYGGTSLYVPFLLSGGRRQDLSKAGLGYAGGINDGGVIAGGDTSGNAVLYNSRNGSFQSIGVKGDAFAVNNAGDATGVAISSGNYAAAFLYHNGQVQSLGTLTGSVQGESIGYALNSKGEVAGESIAIGGRRAFLYSGGVMQNLGTLPGGSNSLAQDINDSSQVVGYSSGNNAQGVGGSYAFLYQNGQMQNLGTLGGNLSAAYGINNSGLIVGEAADAASNLLPFYYQNGTMYNLFDHADNGSQWIFGDAAAVNDKGQIAGVGFHNGSGLTVFLATPLVTPAPGSLSVLLGGAVLLVWRLRKRRMD